MSEFKIEHPISKQLLTVSEEQFDEYTKLPGLQRTTFWKMTKTLRDNGIAEGGVVVNKEPEVSNSVEATLAQRGSRYGDFTDHAAICQELKEVMTGCTKVNPEYPDQRIRGWQLLSSVQRQALEVIADKVARILSGDPNYDDNWHDIQGYAKLVEDRLPCNQNKEV